MDGSPEPSARRFALIGAILGFVGVLLGAFGAHALKGRLGPEALAAWHTAQQYQLLHALALLVVALILRLGLAGRGAVVAAWCFLLGICLFSGSLYLLALTGIRGFGLVTPFGGLSLLAGWAVLASALWRDWK
jgi:uncharacterized membrane protein YgdD (TMEM256/DUF423 family)